MLRPPKQHIAASGTLYAGGKAASAVEPDEAATILRATPYQRGRDRDAPKNDDAAELRQRRSQARLAVDCHPNRIVVQMQDRTRRQYVEDVLQFKHVAPAQASAPLSSEFPLSEVPDASTLDVRVDGAPAPWTYDAGSVVVDAEPGATVVVRYRVPAVCSP